VQALHQRDKAVAAESLAKVRLGQAELARTQAEESRAQAEKHSRVASAVTSFFTNDVLDLKPAPDGTPEPTVRQVLDAIPEKIDRYFKDEPAIEGVIRERVGLLYRRLGEIERSRAYLEDAVPLLEKGLSPDHKQTLAAVQRLGELNLDMGRFDKAVELFDKAYQGRLRAYGLGYHLTMSSLTRRGYARVCAGSVDEGFRDLNEALDHYRTKEGRDSRNAVVTSMNLCDAYLEVGRGGEASDIAREILDIILTKGGDVAGMEWGARMNLGVAHRMLGEPEVALREFDLVLEITGKIYPPNHCEFLIIRHERGRALAALGRHGEAREEMEAAYAIAEACFGAESMWCREIADSLARLPRGAGD
jgi:tetratricopeptide (TPR) repeat protein